MNGYQVQVFSVGSWYVVSEADGCNLMYAECMANYFKERGNAVRIVNLDDGKVVATWL